jgi:hypothetical protein
MSGVILNVARVFFFFAFPTSRRKLGKRRRRSTTTILPNVFLQSLCLCNPSGNESNVGKVSEGEAEKSNLSLRRLDVVELLLLFDIIFLIKKSLGVTKQVNCQKVI